LYVSFVWHAVTWTIYLRDRTHSLEWRDVTWLIYIYTHMYTCSRCLNQKALWLCGDDVWHCLTLLIHLSDITHSYVWHDSFICMTRLIHVWHHSIIRKVRLTDMIDITLSCVWLIHMYDMTHSHVQHDSSVCVTWLIHMCNMTHFYVWHGSLTCVSWLIRMCDMLGGIHVSTGHITYGWTLPHVIQDCIYSQVTCMTPFICDVTLRPLHIWMDPVTCHTGLHSLTCHVHDSIDMWCDPRVTSHINGLFHGSHHIWMDLATCHRGLYSLTCHVHDSIHMWRDPQTTSHMDGPCHMSYKTAFTHMSCAWLHLHVTWPSDHFTYKWTFSRVTSHMNGVFHVSYRTGVIHMSREYLYSRVTSHRPRMEKSHSNHHELLVCCIVNILMVPKVQKNEISLALLYEIR